MTAQHGDVATGPGWELRCGRWQDVLPGVVCDALIVDSPYSEVTHEAYSPRTDALTACTRDAKWAARGGERRTIDYTCWTEADVADAVTAWAPMTRGWMCAFSDDVLAPTWRAEMARVGRFAFSGLSCVEPGSRVRLLGDGPSQWSTIMTPSRPRTREWASWGTLPGAYVVPAGESGQRSKLVTGGKPLWLMRAVVRDYSRSGDVVLDPCAGGGTTLLAAVMEGRRAIGSECDPLTFDKAVARLRKGFTAPLPGMEAPRMEQTGLDL